MSSLSAVNTKFTLNLFQQLRKAEGNVFYSPASIMSALAMLYLGSKGNTARQMEKVGESGNVHQQFQKLLIELNKRSDAYELEIANRVYGGKRFQFLQEYLDDLEKFYLANVESLDFQNAPEESRKKINSWVESQTHEKIKDLFPSGTIDPLFVLVLVNAVYFKGKWEHKFDKKHTTKAKFWLNKNVNKPVQMMRESRSFPFAFLEDVQAKILEIPYTGKQLSMIVLLPNKADGLQKLEDKLTAEKLQEWSSPDRMHVTGVDVRFPRFKVEQRYDLEAVLGAIGMEDVFRPRKADLSGMTGGRGLWVSKIAHKSFVEVNEEGTEAAASVADVPQIAVPQVGPVPNIQSFHCDHPFLFLIKQKKTNSILFFGRVSSPEV